MDEHREETLELAREDEAANETPRGFPSRDEWAQENALDWTAFVMLESEAWSR